MELTREERYANNRAIGMVTLEGAKIIYKTNRCNLAGDPEKGYKGSTQRYCNLSVPEDLARHLLQYGVNVQETKPYGDEDEYVPYYFVKAIAGFRDDDDDWRNPNFYTVKDGRRRKLNRENLVTIDKGPVRSVKATLNPSTREDGGVTMYIRTFYAIMADDDDPFAKDFPDENDSFHDEEEVPFL